MLVSGRGITKSRAQLHLKQIWSIRCSSEPVQWVNQPPHLIPPKSQKTTKASFTQTKNTRNKRNLIYIFQLWVLEMKHVTISTKFRNSTHCSDGCSSLPSAVSFAFLHHWGFQIHIARTPTLDHQTSAGRFLVLKVVRAGWVKWDDCSQVMLRGLVTRACDNTNGNI